MKKLITLFAICLTMIGSAQDFSTLLNGTYTANTTGTAKEMLSDNPWSIQLVWSAASGTVNGVIYIEVSNDNANWTTFASNSSKTISGASGSWFYDVGSNQNTWRFIRARYVKNGTTRATIKVYFNQHIKKVQ